ncbi:phospholipase D family protein [Rickettsia endosymbiont of Halotydeus destructor]|uniref:phospholipase D family nuclease n=1 Tax=Rickettsia endosymbiont of Halotydeus destructor TaxID=2996754 RepID=UPI003BB06CBD
MREKRNTRKFTEIIIIFILGIALGSYLENPDYFTNLFQTNFSPPNNIVKSTLVNTHQEKNNERLPDYKISQISRSKVSACFTPPSGCTKFIAGEIDKAQSSIYMQAYGMSDALITEALIMAQARGVKVRLLLDRSNLKQKFSKIHELQRAKIDVGIDKVPGIAHNKVIIIDKQKVITGSFNFTVSADTRNAENVIVIEDKELAASYLQNWLSRKAKNQGN